MQPCRDRSWGSGFWIYGLVGAAGGLVTSGAVAVAVLPPSPNFVCGGGIGGWLGVIVRREESGEMRR
ncbi:unnamed protein product [Linum tenue]|uniref:Uncharacterized protein n=1 Tax=Linum tenue TaxID=586396 RepID=A0AAV0Q5A5_9ROSI|nr:unnamed protein product [Linum tenue]